MVCSTSKTYSPPAILRGANVRRVEFEARALEVGVGDRGAREDAGEVLGLKAWFRAMGADVDDLHRLARDGGQGDGGPEDLPPAFAV